MSISIEGRNHLQILDDALEYITSVGANKIEPAEILRYLNFECCHNLLFDEMDLILKKLFNDGYIEYNNSLSTPTFNGYAFMEQGGYIEQQRISLSENIRLGKLEQNQMDQQMWMTGATVTAAVLALLALIVTYMDAAAEHDWPLSKIYLLIPLFGIVYFAYLTLK